MAQNNKRKTASGSQSSNKRNTSTKRKNSSGSKRPTQPQKVEKQSLFDNSGTKKQIASCVLFIVALFLVCIIVIPSGSDSNAWQTMKDGFFGLFGVSACTVPPLLFFLSYVIAKEKPARKYMLKLCFSVLGIIFITSLLYVIRFDSQYLKDYSLGDQVSFAWEEGFKFYNFGVLGAFFGGLLALLCGKVASIVTLLILLFLVFMVLSGTTMSRLFEAFGSMFGGIRNMFASRRDAGDDGEHDKKEATKNYRRPESEDIYSDDDNSVAVPKRAKRKKQNLDVGFPGDEYVDTSAVIDEPQVEAGEDFVPNQPMVVPDFDPMPRVDFSDDSNSSDNSPVVNDNENVKDNTDEPFQFSFGVNNGSDSVVTDGAAISEEAENKPADSEKEKVITDTKIIESVDEPDDQSASAPQYIRPDIECLAESNSSGDANVKEELTENGNKLVETLRSFNIETKIVDISRGPSVTRYEIQPAPGIKISRIANLSDDIAMNLAASGVRIEAPIPNKAAVGIEIPNRTRLTVSLREIIDSPQFKSATSNLNVALGKDISGNVACTDLAKMPHLLIAGTTGSVKSVCLNAMIVSILFNSTPDEVKLIMIDPKQVEFTVYKDIPHLMVPVVSDPRKAAGALAWAVSEMTKRYKMFSEKGVRDIRGYNKLAAKDPEMTPMYQICIFIDELSDLMMVAQNEVEDSICRLAQMARAAGMHLVIATQRPSVNVITGIIKANIPSRIALFVSSQVDSRTIIDTAGAEKLLGYGDMLFSPVGQSKPTRLQGCFVSDEEVERVVDFIKAQGQCEYDSDVMEEIEKQAIAEKKKNDYQVDADASPDSGADEETMRAIAVVVENQLASTTLLQRKLKIGYAKAARIMDELEEKGIIGPFEGSKPRKVLMSKQQYNEMIALGDGNIFVETDNGEE